MYCDNCGARVDDDAAFCPKCGQQLLPQKAPVDIPPPTRTPYYRRRRSEDNLCFGEEREDNPWVGGVVLICIGLFLVIIFFVPAFPIELLIPLGFFACAAITFFNAYKKGQDRG